MHNVNCHEILITDKVLLKLECGVANYLYLPCVGTKHTKANGKRGFEAFLQCYCLHGILSMLYKCKARKRYCRYVRQPTKHENDKLSLCETTNVFIDALCYSKIHFQLFGPLKLIKPMLKSLHVLLRLSPV